MEGISGAVLGAAAYGGDIAEFAVGVRTADTLARIDALLVVAGGLAGWTVRVVGALRSAGDQRVTQPVLQIKYPFSGLINFSPFFKIEGLYTRSAGVESKSEM